MDESSEIPRNQAGTSRRIIGAPTSNSIPDQIDMLEALRDHGMITDDELEARKADLLGQK